MIETFIPHPFGQRPRIGCQTSNSDGDVIVNFEDFLLVGGQFVHGAFECAEDGVGVGAQADAGGSLFDGFHCVFNLEKAAFGGPHCDVGVVLVAEHFDG